MSNAPYISDETFQSEVLNSPKPALVDFTASWCGPCAALSPTLDELAEARDDIKIVKIDVGGDRETKEDTNPKTREEYGIQVFPTLVLFRDGNIADVKLGGSNKKNLESWIDTALAKDPSQDMNKDQYIAKMEADRAVAEKKMNRVLGVMLGAIALWKMGKISSGLTGAVLGAVSGSPIMSGLGLATTAFSTLEIHDDLQIGDDKKKIRPRLKDKFLKAYNYGEGLAYAANGYLLFQVADQTSNGLVEASVNTLGYVSAVSGALKLTSMILGEFKSKAKPNSEANKPELATPDVNDDGLICEDGVCRLPTAEERENNNAPAP